MMNRQHNIVKPKLTFDVRRPATSNVGSSEDWCWVKYKDYRLNYDPGNPANYYESTLKSWMDFPSFNGEAECEFIVIGGGLLGSSTALHLAESGLETILLEKDRIGSGASGRNGGQLTPGLARWEAETMLEQFSFEEAQRLWRFTANEAMDLIDDISDRYGLSLDRQIGHLTAAVHPGHMNALVKASDARMFLGDSSVKVLGSYELQNHINSDVYHGGILDSIGGQIHSLALNRGLAYGFLLNGGVIYEQSEVIRLETCREGTRVYTESGTLIAKRGVILAVHDATYKLLTENTTTTIPFYSYVGVTAPVTDGNSSLLPTGKPVYDTQLQIDYYRPVRNERLLIGGEGTGIRWDDNKTVEYLSGRLQSIFPQRQDLELEFAWSGTTDLTLNGATDCRKNGPIYSVHGWNGHGIAQTVRIGQAIRDDILGINNDFKMLTQIKHTPLSMGRILAPVAIPIAKTLLGITTRLSPGKMISF